MAASHSPGGEVSDAEHWWRAYQLAEHDQDDELRKLAAAGDDHARRRLARWLSDRAFTGQGLPDRAVLEEAIEVIGPLAEAGDDVAELWLARWLADCDRLAELRERADSGSYHASRKLARRLADQDMLDELRARAERGDYHARCALITTLAERDMREELRERIEAADTDTRQLIFEVVGGSSAGMNVRRAFADLGHEASQAHLARWLAREGCLDELRQRAESGDEYAQYWLGEASSQS